MAKFLRLAMWSGPRNISTAMMRAWGNRSDTIVIDEPLYAFYLARTGKKHPGAEEVIERGGNRLAESGCCPNDRRSFIAAQKRGSDFLSEADDASSVAGD